MAIPEVFGVGALTFGASYLFVMVLHLGVALLAIAVIAIEQRLKSRKA